MAMGHTWDALWSRNSASLGPGASMWSAKRLDAGRRVVGLEFGETTERPRLSWVVPMSLRYRYGTPVVCGDGWREWREELQRLQGEGDNPFPPVAIHSDDTV